METFLNFLVEHGYAVVFAWVALDQAGLALPAVPILLGAGALVDPVRASNGATPLYIACQAGHTRCVQLLLEAGAAAGHSAGNERTMEATNQGDTKWPKTDTYHRF